MLYELSRRWPGWRFTAGLTSEKITFRKPIFRYLKTAIFVVRNGLGVSFLKISKISKIHEKKIQADHFGHDNKSHKNYQEHFSNMETSGHVISERHWHPQEQPNQPSWTVTKNAKKKKTTKKKNLGTEILEHKKFSGTFQQYSDLRTILKWTKNLQIVQFRYWTFAQWLKTTSKGTNMSRLPRKENIPISELLLRAWRRCSTS